MKRLTTDDAQVVVAAFQEGQRSSSSVFWPVAGAESRLLEQGVPEQKLVPWAEAAVFPLFKQQKALFGSVARAARSQFLEGLDTSSRARVRSCGGFGAGAFLWALPGEGSQTEVTDGAFAFAVKWRLGLPLSSVSCCQVWNRSRGCVCGAVLDEFGHHSAVCKCGGFKVFRHSRLVAVLRSLLRESGAVVEPGEVVVPAWRRPDGKQARLDVVATVEGVRQYFDVTVRHPLARHVVGRASDTDGAAAAVGEEQKRVRYPPVPSNGLPEVTAFAVESFGRLGASARKVLQEARFRVAERDSRCRGWVSAALQARWLGQLGCALVKAQFGAFLATVGESRSSQACSTAAGVGLAQTVAAWT